MPENTEEKNTTEEKVEKTQETEKPSYYYDDACGYEIYEAEDEDENL